MNTAKIVLGEIIMLKMLIGLNPGLGFLGRGVPRKLRAVASQSHLRMTYSQYFVFSDVLKNDQTPQNDQNSNIIFDVF